MKKKAYINPEISVSDVEARQMMACSDGLYRHESPAREEFEVLTNQNCRIDLWDN